MSVYASLVSLHRTLGSILDRGGPRSLGIRGELRRLRETVVSLLEFLENPATQIPEQETTMREAAYKAEDLIQFEISADLESDSTCFHYLMEIIYAIFVSLFVSSDEAIHFWFQIFMVRRLAAVAICTIYNVVRNIALPDLTELKVKELHRVSSSLSATVVRIKEMLGCAAELRLLEKTLDSVIDSISGGQSPHRDQLKSLHEEVCAFLGKASTHTTTTTTAQDLDARIKAAASDVRGVIETQFPAQFIDQVSNWIKLCVIMEISFLASLSNLPALAFFTIIMLAFINSKLILATSLHVMHVCTQLLELWFIAIVLGFCSNLLSNSVAGVVKLLTGTTANSSDQVQENQELSRVIRNLSSVMSEGIYGNPSDLPPAGEDSGGAGKIDVVGLEGYVEDIRDCLCGDPGSNVQVISIVGMGGIGKTTLAREVYNVLIHAHYFDVRAWVTLSHECSPRPVLLSLLDSVKILTKQMQKDNEEGLGLHLYQFLCGRRFLIVMDNLWDIEVLEFVKRFLPDDKNGSRVLLTSRLSFVAGHQDDSGRSCHQMQVLNEEDSWELLYKKVFGAQGGCPEELVSIGKEIAKGCRGLPLAIVVIGGVLSQDKQRVFWEEIAEKLKNSQIMEIREPCLEILGLSYKHLPHHLRPCFLYMAVFSVDSEIPVSKLIKLWAAEGFLKPCTTKSSEEVAEDYLKDLIERNLILVSKRSCTGKIRTCSIHNMLRGVCVENAGKENFLHFKDSGSGSGTYVTRERPYALQVNPKRVLLSCDKYYHSFLCTGSRVPSVDFLDFVYLRVLDVLAVHFEAFPDQTVELVSLRYLALSCDGPLPPSMSKLHCLETLVHHHCSFNRYPSLPPVIWNMPSLRHLYVKPGCYLSDPLGYRLPWYSTVLKNLQTLMGVRNFRWSRGIIKRIPNLKKLGISYDAPPSGDWSEYQLGSLFGLKQLEILKINYHGSGLANLPELAFPQTLKKLSLSGFPSASIGALKNLQALKLRREVCSGSSWKTSKGQFPQLIFLLLEEVSFTCWETEEAHFPRLKRLVLKSCNMLQEIPNVIGDISTLEMIELVDCCHNPSLVDSANDIKEKQDCEGHDIRVCA